MALWACTCGGIMDPIGGGYYKCRECGREKQMEFEVDDDDDEYLSVDEAADIWLSNGMDEDYMFGYTEEELRNAAGV